MSVVHQFLKRSQPREKMFSITNYWRNTNQNYNEVSPHTSQNGHHQNVYKQKMLERMWRKENLRTLLVGM